VAGTLNLLDAIRSAGVGRLVFSSTAATYGEPDEVPILESAATIPTNPYGASKLSVDMAIGAECAAAAAAGRAFGATSLRYFNVAGASGDYGELHDPETHLIPLVLQAALGRRSEVQIFGDDYPTPDGTCIRDYIHVEDLAEAHLAALARLQGGRERLFVNLGTGTGYSVREVIEAVERVTARKVPCRVVARRPGDPPRLVSGGRRALEELGWRARRAALDDIVADAWRFLLEHPDGFAQ